MLLLVLVGKSELTFNPDGSKKTEDIALSREYITEYSYGIMESFNLIAPRLFGGSNSEALGKDSAMFEFMVGQGVPKIKLPILLMDCQHIGVISR